MTRVACCSIAAPAAALLLAFASPADLAAQNQPVVEPASYDFGPKPLGTSEGTNFLVLNLPSTGPATAVIRGDPSFSFTRPVFLLPPAARQNAARLPNEISVMFKPTSYGLKTATLIVTIGSRTINVPLKGMGAFNCRPRLVECNYDFLYSGRFYWRATSDIPPLNPVPNGTWQMLKMEESVSAVLQDGVVICEGTFKERRDEFTKQVHDYKWETQGIVNGRGLITIEFGETVNPKDPKQKSRWYEIKVSCPTASGSTVGTNMRTGESETEPLEVDEADMRRNVHYTDRRPGSLTDAELAGADSAITTVDPETRVRDAYKREWRFVFTMPKVPAPPKQ